MSAATAMAAATHVTASTTAKAAATTHATTSATYTAAAKTTPAAPGTATAKASAAWCAAISIVEAALSITWTPRIDAANRNPSAAIRSASVSAAKPSTASVTAATIPAASAPSPTAIPAAVIPGPRADKYAAVEPIRSIVAVRSASVRIIRVISPITHWSSVDHGSGNHHGSDAYIFLNILGLHCCRKRQSQQRCKQNQA